MRKLNDNEELQIGDWVIEDLGPFGKRKNIITRVTKTMSICKKQRGQEWADDDFMITRYPRTYCMSFHSIPRYAYSTIRCTVFTNRE